MEYSSFIVFYDVSDSSKFNMNLFLEEKLKMFDSIEEAFEDINDFIHKYNYLMNYLNKDYIYSLQTTIKECEIHLRENEFKIVGETKNKEFRIVVKKVHTE